MAIQPSSASQRGVGGGLTAIAERLNAGGAEEIDEYEEHDVGGDGGSDEEQDEAEVERQEELQKGMDGERVLRAGYLYKKQEKRKVWKKKWFVLRTGKLAYYKDDKVSIHLLVYTFKLFVNEG